MKPWRRNNPSIEYERNELSVNPRCAVQFGGKGHVKVTRGFVGCNKRIVESLSACSWPITSEHKEEKKKGKKTANIQHTYNDCLKQESSRRNRSRIVLEHFWTNFITVRHSSCLWAQAGQSAAKPKVKANNGQCDGRWSRAGHCVRAWQLTSAPESVPSVCACRRRLAVRLNKLRWLLSLDVEHVLFISAWKR